jgi:REP element-mobilizing transposase RayT
MYDKTIHHRRSIRLRGYDYSRPGSYSVTICSQGMLDLFGEIVEGEMKRNPFGEIVWSCWNDLPRHYARVELDSFVIMPNHVHGIIVIRAPVVPLAVPLVVRAGLKPAPTKLSEIVRGFKTFSARRINATRGTPGTSVWQRNYYERIIRNDDELNKIREYINTNPLRAETGWENILGT